MKKMMFESYSIYCGFNLITHTISSSKYFLFYLYNYYLFYNFKYCGFNLITHTIYSSKYLLFYLYNYYLFYM